MGGGPCARLRPPSSQLLLSRWHLLADVRTVQATALGVPRSFGIAFAGDSESATPAAGELQFSLDGT
eukprot:4144333-Pyramimonas_sp.AAC.1